MSRIDDCRPRHEAPDHRAEPDRPGSSRWTGAKTEQTAGSPLALDFVQCLVFRSASPLSAFQFSAFQLFPKAVVRLLPSSTALQEAERLTPQKIVRHVGP